MIPKCMGHTKLLTAASKIVLNVTAFYQMFVRKLLVLVVKCPLLIVINIRTSYYSTGRQTRRRWLEKNCEYSPVSTSGRTESFQISSGVSELKPLMYAPSPSNSNSTYYIGQ